MSLLLTSSGLDNKKVQNEFLKLLDGKSEKQKVLIIFGVKTKFEIDYFNESKKELIDLEILKGNLIEANINENISGKDFKEDFDVVYLCGGNTFHILDRLRKTGFDKLIKKLVEKNKVYVGVSAGSIIAGPNIEIAGWGSEGDMNKVGLKNLEGFNFTNMALFPHYRDELKEEVDEFRKTVSYPVKNLKDGEFIAIK